MEMEGDFDMANLYEDVVPQLPNAEPFPMMSGALGGNDLPQDLLAAEDRVYEKSSEVISSNVAGAPRRSRKARSRNTLGADRIVELRNSDLIQWQKEYKSNMAAATLLALQRKASAQAKKNAFWFVCETGLNGVGNGVGSSKIPSPLEKFSHEHLLSITGKATSSGVSKSKQTKRNLDKDVEEQVTPKRSRKVEVDNDIGRGHFEDDQGILIMEDSSVGMEIGRDAASALPDHPSSIIMPWNVSASLHSYQRGASSSHHGYGLGPAGHHPPITSPLVGRGSALPGPLEQFSQQEDEIMNGCEDDSRLQPGHSQAEFEMFGPAAQVDTQTAADSQWVRDALAREAGNFFEYVLNTISEKAGEELGEGMHAGAASNGKFTTFEELFDPVHNSRIVAAQAFYHVLTLATKNRIWVEQDGNIEPFRSIRIGVVD
jgi:meiotic recombination protein REC8